MLNLTHLRYLLEEARSHYYYSGYQFYAEAPVGTIRLCGGSTSYWPNAKPITENTLFDLGSLTKVILTTSVIARWWDQKMIDLEDPLKKYLPKLPDRLGALTIKLLLCHATGLATWLPYYRQSKTLMEWICSEPNLIVGEHGRESRYSDINFFLLGLLIEAIAGSIEHAFDKEVRIPLGLNCCFNPPLEADVAATEFCLWRNRLLQGEVFDENCAAMGGIGAHAGLFAAAIHVAPFVREWLIAWNGNSRWLSQKAARLFTARCGLSNDSTWAYGWDTKSDRGSSAGDFFSKNSFGHLGYPGCSIWIDPLVRGFVIFFSNRVHPSRADQRIKKLRPLVHNEVAQLWRMSV